MTLLVGFAVALMAAVLISAYAQRSVLSTAVLFLGAGILVGVLFPVENSALEGNIELVAELALFSVLFTDGMRVGYRDLLSAWRLPGRALLLGMPLSLVGTAVLAHVIAGLPWTESFLVGAALAPTDPVFAAAIVGREGISGRLRYLLNVESGLNDGLALPVVLVLLAASGGEADTGAIATELVLGVVIGVAVPLVVIALERLPALAASEPYEPLTGFAIGAVVFAVSLATHANLFLAAFAAGVTVASAGPEFRESFHRFGELIAELLKLAALFLFGVLVQPSFLGEIPLGGWAFALLALVLVRPVALSVALYGSGLEGRELAAAAWFGPKGFASVVYGLLIAQSGIPLADEVFHLIALVVVASIVAHSSTDVVIARRLQTDSAHSSDSR